MATPELIADYSGVWQVPEFLRVFLSHKAECKATASELRGNLLSYGISCFVAHEDVEPTHEWQDEIEKALHSMEAMVVLLTDEFHNSNWTDQEVGIAIGRAIPIVPIRLGCDPYGFIGKYQALPGTGKNLYVLAREVFEILFSKFPSIKARLAEALVAAFESANSFDHANRLMGYLLRIEAAPQELIDRLENAPNRNRQIRFAFEVEENLPGLVKRLRESRQG